MRNSSLYSGIQMTSSLKSILVIIITAILHGHAFSQGDASALALYNTGESLVKTNPEKAFKTFEKSMELAQADKEWDLYIKSLNSLAFLKLKDQGDLKIK